MPDRGNCRVIVMDLCDPFRNLARKHFNNAIGVVDRFHVVKLINKHFLKSWSILDEEGNASPGTKNFNFNEKEGKLIPFSPTQRVGSSTVGNGAP